MAEQQSTGSDPHAEVLTALCEAVEFLLVQEIERSRMGISRAETYGRAERLRDELRRVSPRRP